MPSSSLVGDARVIEFRKTDKQKNGKNSEMRRQNKA